MTSFDFFWDVLNVNYYLSLRSDSFFYCEAANECAARLIKIRWRLGEVNYPEIPRERLRRWLHVTGGARRAGERLVLQKGERNPPSDTLGWDSILFRLFVIYSHSTCRRFQFLCICINLCWQSPMKRFHCVANAKRAVSIKRITSFSIRDKWVLNWSDIFVFHGSLEVQCVGFTEEFRVEMQ